MPRTPTDDLQELEKRIESLESKQQAIWEYFEGKHTSVWMSKIESRLDAFKKLKTTLYHRYEELKSELNEVHETCDMDIDTHSKRIYNLEDVLTELIDSLWKEREIGFIIDFKVLLSTLKSETVKEHYDENGDPKYWAVMEKEPSETVDCDNLDCPSEDGTCEPLKECYKEKVSGRIDVGGIRDGKIEVGGIKSDLKEPTCLDCPNQPDWKEKLQQILDNNHTYSDYQLEDALYNLLETKEKEPEEPTIDDQIVLFICEHGCGDFTIKQMKPCKDPEDPTLVCPI